ncbi:hypothetical protein L1049_027519 [Liquidambar formosana]|uniref:Uncharacterized protein n=1 Tax=Liquidambar formosana TaxID=63359 RepID=A0AAP0RHJ9_LIQFO
MVHPNSFLVVTINGTGLIMEIIYIAIFFIFSSWSKRWKMFVVLIIEIGFVAVIVFVTLTFVHGNKSRSMLVGILCLVFNIIMYTSPLTIMRRVIRSKSVKYMPFYLSLAYFVNGLVWMIYALIPLDPYIAISNGLGALSGLVQLILYATYYSTTPKDEDERISELQLSMP